MEKLDQCWMTRSPARVYHSGDLGDIIYSLLFARTLGRVVYIIGPSNKHRPRQDMTPARFLWLVPLLARQPWIEAVFWNPQPPPVLTYNLNDFRDSWFSPAYARRRDKQLWKTYQEHFRSAELPQNEPWLVADPAPDSNHPIVIHRSARWRNENFPWPTIAKRYRGQMVFVGLQEEFADWTRRFGNVAEYRPVVDALDMANIIAGSRLFIGNQSLPMAIAMGLKKDLIQETCLDDPDCIFARDNAQFTNGRYDIALPSFTPHPHVTRTTNGTGHIELGPCAGAEGIGDTLMLTPVTRILRDKAVMILPPRMARMAFFFHGQCEVRISEDHPVVPWPGKMLQSAGHLRRLGLPDSDVIPSITLRPGVLEKARAFLSHYPRPLAFCPTCSRHWVNDRQRPLPYWEPLLKELSSRFTILQFGLPDYPLFPKAIRMPFFGLEELAAIYQVISIYLGVNTGDYHLMIAVGGKAAVANPDPWGEHESWTYPLPARVCYGSLNNPDSIKAAFSKLT